MNASMRLSAEIQRSEQGAMVAILYSESHIMRCADSQVQYRTGTGTSNDLIQSCDEKLEATRTHARMHNKE
jgi:hypothetical protein